MFVSLYAIDTGICVTSNMPLPHTLHNQFASGFNLEKSNLVSECKKPIIKERNRRECGDVRIAETRNSHIIGSNKNAALYDE